jgi:hypothetical protein
MLIRLAVHEEAVVLLCRSVAGTNETPAEGERLRPLYGAIFLEIEWNPQHPAQESARARGVIHAVLDREIVGALGAFMQLPDDVVRSFRKLDLYRQIFGILVTGEPKELEGRLPEVGIDGGGEEAEIVPFLHEDVGGIVQELLPGITDAVLRKPLARDLAVALDGNARRCTRAGARGDEQIVDMPLAGLCVSIRSTTRPGGSNGDDRARRWARVQATASFSTE